MYKHMLVPIDDTPLAFELVNEAVWLAKTLGARITFFHIKADESSIYGDAALLRASDPQSYFEHYQWAARSVLARAESSARLIGVEFDSISHRKHGSIADGIIKAAVEFNCDLIVMASHGRNNRLAKYLSSTSIAVLSQTSISFLQVAPRAGGDRIMRRALGRIEEEHRTLDSVMRGILLLSEEHSGSATLDREKLEIFEGAIQFLREFAGRQHHPKEEQYLFAKLRTHQTEMNKTEMNKMLNELQHQHVREEKLLAEAQEALNAARAGQGPQKLFDQIEALAEHIWKHMAMEERDVLPMARNLLTATDWAELNDAFSGHTDPQFRTEDRQAIESMYKHLINLLPHTQIEK